MAWRRQPLRLDAALAVTVLFLTMGCTRHQRKALAPQPATPPFTYVAVGASDTVGVGAPDPGRQSWPSVFRSSALPPSTTYVNVGVSGATVRDALAQELPRALERSPALVSVWLNVNDLFALVSVADYERDLATLVHALRRGGTTEVLLANTPPLDDLPAVRACVTPGAPVTTVLPCPPSVPPGALDLLRLAVDEYNAAVARVAAREGAVLVDLHAAGLAARADGSESSLISSDGFHPSAAGHERVAATFAAALRSAPATRRFAVGGR